MSEVHYDNEGIGMRSEILARDKKYLEWIREQPCAISGSTIDVVAHHVTIYANRGIGQKPSDYWCIPLRADTHTHLHNLGEREFWLQMEKSDPHIIALGYLTKYLDIDLDDNIELLRLFNDIAFARKNKL